MFLWMYIALGHGGAPDVVIPGLLREFWAVTVNGLLYHILAPPDEEIVVEKVAHKGNNPLRNGSRLMGPADRVAITDWTHMNCGLVVYSPRDNADGTPQLLTETTWKPTRVGGATCPLVGLFLHKGEAEECLDQYDNFSEFDPRWLEQTSKVIAVIGKHHPLFSVELQNH